MVGQMPETTFDSKKQMELEKTEEILVENPGRFVVLPIEYPKVWEEYDQLIYFVASALVFSAVLRRILNIKVRC